VLEEHIHSLQGLRRGSSRLIDETFTLAVLKILKRPANRADSTGSVLSNHPVDAWRMLRGGEEEETPTSLRDPEDGRVNDSNVHPIAKLLQMLDSPVDNVVAIARRARDVLDNECLRLEELRCANRGQIQPIALVSVTGPVVCRRVPLARRTSDEQAATSVADETPLPARGSRPEISIDDLSKVPREGQRPSEVVGVDPKCLLIQIERREVRRLAKSRGRFAHPKREAAASREEIDHRNPASTLGGGRRLYGSQQMTLGISAGQDPILGPCPARERRYNRSAVASQDSAHEPATIYEELVAPHGV
jgi:hypothetical protein